MPDDDEAKVQAFRERADREATAIVAACHDGTVFSYDNLIRMVAIGWLKGAEDARADFLDKLGEDAE